MFYLDPAKLPVLVTLFVLAVISLLPSRPRSAAPAASQPHDDGAESPAKAIRSTLARLLGRSRRLAVYIAPASILGPAAIDTVASLLTADRIIDSASASDTHVILVSCDPPTFLAANGLLTKARRPDEKTSVIEIKFAGADRAALAADAISTFDQKPPDAVVSQGHWGEEFAHLLEIAGRSSTPHLAGSSSFASLPFVYLAGRSSALGEQLFSVADELDTGETPSSLEIARLALLAVLAIVGLGFGVSLLQT